jgi:PAS domain S-box-containing protein
LIIDRELRILKSNRRLQEMIGDHEGAYCYRALKGLDHKCTECTAGLTFKDGQLHTGHHEWRARDGKAVHLHVITVPLRHEDGTFDSIMELAVDVSRTIKLEDGLRFAHSFLDTMISTAVDGIFAVNEKGKVTLFNPAARKLLGVEPDQIVSREEIASMLPKGLLARISDARKQVYLPETEVMTLQNEAVPIRLVGTPIFVNERSLGMAFWIQDLRVLKTLEREKLEAERMAAVGQTVAGLAHGIKNLVIALEGGVYMLNTGLNKGDVERIQQGLKMLGRNIHRISHFVKAFLAYAKEGKLRATLNDPAEIAGEVVEMYTAKAAELGIVLTAEAGPDVQPAPIDYERMHECLTNLVGNALDACRAAVGRKGLYVRVKTSEEDSAVIFEVADNGAGMDYEVKKNIFSTVFTTKGLDGTGLGLLMTQKIAHEHGGKISMHSEPGKGTVFRIILPRLRLPKITE